MVIIGKIPCYQKLYCSYCIVCNLVEKSYNSYCIVYILVERYQLNDITAYVDGSQVYGSSNTKA